MTITGSGGRRIRLGRRGRAGLAGAAGVALMVGTAMVGQAADQPTLDELELRIQGGYVPHALLGVDT